MTGSIKIGSLITLPPTQKRIETPIHVTSVVWNPEGKIAYESLSPPTDPCRPLHRFKGNTKGLGAVTACSLAPAWPHLRRSAIAR